LYNDLGLHLEKVFLTVLKGDKMSIFLIAVVAIIVIIVAGILIAQGTAVFDAAVRQNRVDIENHIATGGGYNPALTMGYEIPLNVDYETQVREARRLAAKEAATKPRGGNFGIGRLGQESELKTAWKGAEKDPITAVKIAAHHGWDGLKTGYVVAPAAPPPEKTPETGEKIELVPGKDYPVIEITDDMSLSEKRKARIANAKAKSAAVKAAKAAGVTSSAAPPPAAAPVAATPEPAPAAASSIPEPELIEITDDMTPEEIRKARIANAKAKSAYKKALKAAGLS
jgi:hypothetical protein